MFAGEQAAARGVAARRTRVWVMYWAPLEGMPLRSLVAW